MYQWIVHFFFDPLRRANDEQRRTLTQPGDSVDRETIAVCLTVSICLIIQYYFFHLNVGFPHRADSSQWLPAGVRAFLLADENREIIRLGYRTMGDLLAYVVIPVAVMKLVCGRSLADYGLGFKGATSGWWVYLLMCLVMIGPIIMMSYRVSFQQTYPFYQLQGGESLWPRFIVWEILYALQFIGLEFFFRGFLLHGTRRRFGAYAILAMTIPYCMIHFGKPLPEACGSIVAGVVLGFMSLKTGSVWLSAAVHIAVAWSIDTASLWQKGLLGGG